MSEAATDAQADTLAHGRWQVTLSLGEVGHVRLDGVEVLRAVRVVARDADWNTWPHRTAPAEVVTDGAGATLRLQTEILDQENGSPLAEATVHVRLDDACTVSATIRPLRPLEVNRLGIVVLHPPGLAGAPFTVEHPDGAVEQAVFPEHIAPHQPASDIRALRYSVGGHRVVVTLDGDVFEMEDQRNWTDASFKTYSRPLALPFPYRLTPDDTVRQSVRIGAVEVGALRVGSDGLEARHPSAPHGTFTERTVPTPPAGMFRVPEIGTSSSRHVDGPLPPRAPHAGPLLVELTTDRSSWPTIVARAAVEANALGVPVDLRVVAADADGLAAGLAAARDLHVARVGVFDPVTHVTERPAWDALRRWRDARPTSLPLVAGTRAHFTELNRTIERLPRDADLVAFSMTPMMHATDPEHVEESLAMQPLVARDAVLLADGIPVVVGPITFRRRFNAVATTPSPGSVVEAARGIDPVVGTEYAASWLARSVDAVSVPGVLAASWFEATGPRGLVAPSGELTPAGAFWLSLVS